MADPAIEVHGLRKSYGTVEAVRGIDLRIERGEVFALLGPNGAGKTTTIEMLEGFRPRNAGEVRVLGYDPARGEQALRARIGVVLQSTGVQPYLTVEESIEMYRGYYPHPYGLDDVLEVVGLTAQRRTRVKRLSGGQQRRLDVAIGLCGNPELLFLDEPTTGFDPSARRQAWEMVRRLRELGKTVLLTTHYMDEAEQLADRVAIIARGQIVATGAPRDLMRQHRDVVIAFRAPEQATLPEGLGAVSTLADGRVAIETSALTATLYTLTRWAVERGEELAELSVTGATLEEAYLRLTGAADAADRVGTAS